MASLVCQPDKGRAIRLGDTRLEDLDDSTVVGLESLTNIGDNGPIGINDGPVSSEGKDSSCLSC